MCQPFSADADTSACYVQPSADRRREAFGRAGTPRGSDQTCLMKRFFPLLLLPLLSLPARGELVHVYQQTVAGASTNQLSDTVLETGVSYTTQAAPTIEGWIFTHWSISTAQEYTNRDRWGRALDAVSYTLYEETTLTANYLPAAQDTDADGVADGWEFYWYGSLAQTATSDTDGDGFTFAEELAMGTNPLFADEYLPGGIEWADSALLLYNPFGYQPYVLRSDPEGALFATSTNWVRPGTVVTSPSYDHDSTSFGTWTMNGARQADRWGRALDAVTLTMPSNAVELVAVTAANEPDRQALYWYGCPAESAPSDSDGDGFSFADELAMGTNPLFADEYPPGGIEWADSDLLLYNPFCIQPYVIRSEPEGALLRQSDQLGACGHDRFDGDVLAGLVGLRLLDEQRRTAARLLGPRARRAFVRDAEQRGGTGGDYGHE